MVRTGRNTIIEVAERAGVSPTTVSHVLSGNRPVAAETQARVRSAIEALGYRPSATARSLRLQRSDTIALIVPDISNPFYPAFAGGVYESLNGRYLTFVCNTTADPELERRFVADLHDRHVDGMIIATFSLVAADLGAILDAGVPVVSLGPGLDDDRIDLVMTDDEHGAILAMDYDLIERDHTRIGLIRGTSGGGELRTTGYRRALEQAGIDYDPALAITGDWVRSGGASAMRSLLELAVPPTAVFAANDLMAIGAIDTIREHGLRVPEDVAVVGYDDIEAAALLDPPLTTVVNPVQEAGAEAGRLLVDRMSGRYDGERRVVSLQARLAIRGTT